MKPSLYFAGGLLLGLVALNGCASVKSVQKSLSDAAAIANGPCALKVAEAVAVCKEELPK